MMKLASAKWRRAASSEAKACPIMSVFGDCSKQNVCNICHSDEFLAATKQLWSRTLQSVRPSVCHTFFTMFLSSYHHEIFRSYYYWQVTSMQKSRSEVKGEGHRRSNPNLAVSGQLLQFDFTYGDEMMPKAWCGTKEIPSCFSRSSVKFQGHTGQKITNFDQNYAFPDCNPISNSPMAMKLCTKLKVP